MDELNRIRNKNKPKPKKYKLLVTIMIFSLLILILQNNKKISDTFYKYIYEDNFSFAFINNIYEKYFGGILPKNEAVKVFNETLKYTSSSKYMDGCALEVTSDYLVPNQKKGIVIFIGEKEGYGNTVIIEQYDGIDVWYSNLKEVDVNLYDYIETNALIGSVDNTLYLVYKKDGKVLNYEDFI